jgi:DNA-binding LacI/PurR family transcriptional regulator
MGERMEEYGFDLMILRGSRTRQPNETYTQMLIRKGVRGAVLRTTSKTRAICEEIADEGFPAVVVGDHFDNPKVRFVSSDSRSGSRQAIEHLLKLGHRRIAFCTNVVDDSDHTDRYQGYADAMTAAGIELDPALVLRTPANRTGGEQIIRRTWVGENRPTAIYLADPMAALGAMHELVAMGLKVPKDVSVVGFDDSEMRHLMEPKMTAVCQDAAEVGREAFQMLHGIINSSQEPPVEQRILPTVLEIYGSTAAP